METKQPIPGLHHVTATVGGAQADYDFYTGLLGLRLVKQTVNFDDHDVYHFYYGNRQGEPGTIMTTFPYAHKGVRTGTIGAGQVAITSFSVPRTAIDFWRDRLQAAGLAVTEHSQFGLPVLRFSDPSGLLLELVGNDEDERAPWTEGGMSAEHAIRGFFTVVLSIAEVEPTYQFLEEIFDAALHAEEGKLRRYRLGTGGPGQYVDVRNDAGQPRGYNGVGTVHHVAFRIADRQQQQLMREYLAERGLYVTPILDRQYFTSIYFRIPGGILFEIATMPPGFAVDEPVEALGRSLKLPAWEEPNRRAIEAGLEVISR